MKSFDYSNTNDRTLYKVLMPIAKLLTKVVYRVRYEGFENIPKEGGYIFASNHVQSIDPVYLGAFFPHALHFMGKSELFENWFTNWFLTGMNGFPIVRGGNDKTSVEFAINLIKDGKVLAIFPEGTREKDLKPGKPKAGVALIAKATHADILPVSIRFEGKPKAFAKAVIRFGEIIPFESLNLNDEERSTAALREASRVIMDRIAELWEDSRFD